MFDITSVPDDWKPSTTISNTNNLSQFLQDYITLKNILTVKQVKELRVDEQEYVLKEMVKINRRRVHDEIVRLLKISPMFIRTEYFQTLANILKFYCLLGDDSATK